jgi:HlyD family secretion protein
MKSTEITDETYRQDVGGSASIPGIGSSPKHGTLTAAPRRSRLPGWLVAVAAAAISAVLAFAAGTRAGKPERTTSGRAAAPAVMSVTVEPAATRPVHQQVKITGSIWAWDPLTISTEVAGLRIESVLVEEGDLVKKGHVLATLNSSILRSELERAHAQLAAALAALDKAVQPNRREDINALREAVAQARANVAQQQAVLVQARANLANAKQNAVRYADLARQGAVSTQEAENKETAATVAEAEVRSALEKVNAAAFALRQTQEHLSMAESGGRKEDIAMARAEVRRIRADISRLQALIQQTVIRSPSDGLVTRRDAHIGDTSAIGKQLFQMVRDNRLELRAQVPERDLPRLSPGQPVRITCVATGARVIEGRLREVSPQVDSSTRLGMIRVDVPAGAGLKPGMFVEGEVQLQDYAALTVPSQAVIVRDDRYHVFVLNGNHAQSRAIEVGARSGDLAEIRSGLIPGEKVITSGAGFLKDGDVVTVVPR